METGRLEGYSEEVFRGRGVKEKCIRCGKETEYDINTPITLRRYFVEGAGQLCEACFHILYPVPGASATYCGGDLGQKRDNDRKKADKIEHF